MEPDYRNIISHIDIDRSLDSIDYFEFLGIEWQGINEFLHDIGTNNDAIELHLIKTKSYKEALSFKLKNNDNNPAWREFLKEEQKTFGGSKIFYMNPECSKLLVLGVPDEMNAKLNMVISRLNKVNEKITRANQKIKKENIDLYAARVNDKNSDKKKEEIMNFINQNLKV